MPYAPLDGIFHIRTVPDVDDDLTIAQRFVSEPTNVRDLELAILRHMEHHMLKERERCAQVAEQLNGWGAPPAPELANHIAKVIRGNI